MYAFPYLEVCNCQGVAVVVAAVVLEAVAVVVVVAEFRAVSSFPVQLVADFQTMAVLWLTSYTPIFVHEAGEVAPG